MKAIDQTPEAAIEHREALQAHFALDGHISTCEATLLHGAQGVYLWAETAQTAYRVGMRVLGGGAVDNQLMASVNDLVRLTQEYRAKGVKS